RPPRRPPPRRRPALRLSDPMKRLNAGLLIIAFILSLFAGRLVQLQAIKGKEYSEAAIKMRMRDIDLPARRGMIIDATGAPLAMTQDAFGIFADPTRIVAARRDEIAARLASVLGLNPADVLKNLTRPNTMYAELAHRVAPEQAKLIMSFKYAGIGTVPESRRVYPANAVASNLIGFVNQAGDGGSGLEYQENKLLKGADGHQLVEIGRDGQHIPMGDGQTKKAVAGQGIQLTINQDIQWKAEELLAAEVKKDKADWGTAVVMTPTGQVLAMASTPTFDPNRYSRASLDALKNRVVQEPFEPGSTGKIVTAAALLERGLVTPESVFTVPYCLYKFTEKFCDSHPHKTQRLTFSGILSESSNTGTMLASERLSQDDIYGFLRAFGFGEKTGIDLPGETAGLLNPPDKWSGTDRWPISFGQTISVSSLQMASVYATIANGGMRVPPTVIAGTYDGQGKFQPAAPPAARQVISPTTAHGLTSMLEAVVNQGTGKSAKLPGYRVAGKTGTAERYDDKLHRYHGYTGMFAGFAPADDPQVVVQVVVHNPQKDYYGGDVAAPVFRELMNFALQTQKVPPTGGTAPPLKLTAD
ncbi:penicillin-binding protein 2, partial [Actinocorallia longicatena]|uniref:peptidoglycan D,D-transpeptidase FtsI family protein n=1 Tax=Actinocorallia longicatena TaxID=111803 RepID=UPI0031D7FAC5